MNFKHFKEKKICFILGAMNVGGVQTFLLNLSAGLIKQGFTVYVIAVQEKGRWWGRLSEFGIHGIFLDKREFLSPATHAIFLNKIIVEKRFDVVLLNHAREAQIAIPLMANSTKIIPIIHNSPEEIIDLALKNDDRVGGLITVSPFLYKIARSKQPRTTLYQVNYPVKMADDQTYAAKRASWNIPIKLVYVGRLHEEQKGIFLLPSILMDCVKNNLRVELIVVGEGDDESNLREKFIVGGVLDRVTFHGAVSPARIQSILLESHALIMPSHYEGLGIVAVEAQGNGCVPIASYLPDVTDHSILDGETGFLVRKGDSKAYFECIRLLYNDRDAWMRMSRKARQHSKENYSIESSVQNYMDIFATVEDMSIQKAPKNVIQRWTMFIFRLSLRDWIPNKFRSHLWKKI